MKRKLLRGLILFLFAIETSMYLSIMPIPVTAINNKILISSTEIYKQGTVKVNENHSPPKQEHEQFHDALISLNVIKALVILSGCVFTAIVSLIGETLVKRLIFQMKDIVLELMSNQKIFENISSEEIVKINLLMKQVRISIKATRLSMFKLHQDTHTLFLESSSSGKYSLSNSPPVARQFFDAAILPMIDNHQKYSYCGSHGDVCSTWLSGRGTGRYAIHLFFYKEDFAGFILAEWNRVLFFDSWLNNDENIDYYEAQLGQLADIINESIRDKK